MTKVDSTLTPATVDDMILAKNLLPDAALDAFLKWACEKRPEYKNSEKHAKLSKSMKRLGNFSARTLRCEHHRIEKILGGRRHMHYY